jgi:hypothetical protein
MTDTQTSIINLAVQELPAVISLFKELFKKQNPDAPEPTNEEVIAAFETAYQMSLAKDDAILNAHTEE